MFSPKKIENVNIRKIREKWSYNVFSKKNFKVLTLEKLEKNGLTMFSPKKLSV